MRKKKLKKQKIFGLNYLDDQKVHAGRVVINMSLCGRATGSYGNSDAEIYPCGA